MKRFICAILHQYLHLWKVQCTIPQIPYVGHLPKVTLLPFDLWPELQSIDIKRVSSKGTMYNKSFKGQTHTNPWLHSNRLKVTIWTLNWSLQIQIQIACFHHLAGNWGCWLWSKEIHLWRKYSGTCEGNTLKFRMEIQPQLTIKTCIFIWSCGQLGGCW